MSILTIKNVNVYYRQFQALYDVSMNVEASGIHGFIGQNGAGKTTLINAILGYLKPREGEIYFEQGSSFEDFSKEVGYVPDAPGFPEFLNAHEYLKDVCQIYQIPPNQTLIDETLNLVGLNVKTQRIKTYSRGMRQKLAIAAGIIHQPRILIMDEPTSALDPLSRRQILDLMLRLKEKMAILYSTHILEDAEKVCNDISIIHQGKISYHGTLKSLLKDEKSHYLIEARGLNKINKSDLKKMGVFDIKNPFAKVAYQGSSSELIKKLIENGVQLESFRPIVTTLEERFKEVIGHVD